MGRWGKDNILKVATDKLAAYKKALENIMSDIPYVYLQIVKRRIKRRLVTVKKYFPGKSQNTSFIERLNLTLRQHISYLQRKTLGVLQKQIKFHINVD